MASISLLCFHRKPCPSSHHLQHKLLHLDTPFKISWTDDNPQTTVIRFRNEEETLVERTASVDPGRGELPIAQEQSEPAQSGPRQKVHLNTADIFPVFTEIERLVTIELSDQDGHAEPLQILFSRHDYEEGYTDPLDLQVSDTGTTIREHLQRRWGDPLPAYESQEPSPVRSNHICGSFGTELSPIMFTPD